MDVSGCVVPWGRCREVACTVANKRKSEKKRSNVNDDSRDEFGIARRIGSGLTLLMVSVVTVVLGFIIGRYVIVDVFNESLGVDLTAQTSPINPGSSSERLPSSGSGAGAGNQTASVTPVASSNTSSVPQTPNVGSTSQGSQSAPISELTPVGTDRPSSPTTPVASPAPSAPVQHTPAAPAPAPSTPTATPSAPAGVLYRVQVGGSSERGPAEQLLESLKSTFPDAFITFNTEFRVQVGAYSTLDGAQEVMTRLRSSGHEDVHLITASR